MIAAAAYLAAVVLLALVVIGVCADAAARARPVRHARGRDSLGLPSGVPASPTEPLALRDDGLPRPALWADPW